MISRDFEGIVIPPKKRQEILNKLRQVLHPFRSCISKINNTEDAEDLGTVTPKYNLYNMLEYSNNYSMTSGSLWNYYKAEIYVFKNNALWNKSFEYKIKITEEIEQNNFHSLGMNEINQPTQPLVPFLNVEVTIPLKYLSNIWTSLHEVDLDLL